ncbi:MAG: protein phosphatase [Pseudomonadota bacterium]
MAFAEYIIAEVTCRSGLLGIGPMPGRSGRYDADLSAILRWGAGLVLTMTTKSELERVDAGRLGDDLAAAGVPWRHLPIPDFGAPPSETDALWPDVAKEAHALLADGGRVFSHCYGGCGRSGMALLRLMVEAGEDTEPALARLRDARPCAVEAETQKAWASIPMYDRYGWSP